MDRRMFPAVAVAVAVAAMAAMAARMAPNAIQQSQGKADRDNGIPHLARPRAQPAFVTARHD